MADMTPSVTTDLTALADRVEAAEGPSGDLAEAVYRACGWVGRQSFADGDAGNWFWFDEKDRKRFHYGDLYRNNPLASIDAALTLVPDALTKNPAWWGVRRGGLTYFHAWLGDREPERDGTETGKWAQANTPALALCAAALRARAA